MHEDSSEPSLPEDAAHRLLARAVELDHARAARVPLAHLRAAAREAGVSDAAFAQALAEADAARAAPGPDPDSMSWRAHVGAHALALVACVGVLVLAVGLHSLSGAGWVVRKAVDPAALALGALIAARLRARLLVLPLAGFALALGAEAAMDAAFGTPAVRGAGAHLALILAGVFGVLLGAFLARRSGATRPRAGVRRRAGRRGRGDGHAGRAAAGAAAPPPATPAHGGGGVGRRVPPGRRTRRCS
jgi:hypothetical protein